MGELKSAAEYLEGFVSYKRSAGYSYCDKSKLRLFERLADFLDEGRAPGDPIVGREAAMRWIAPRYGERPRTREERIAAIRQFALYLIRLGHEDCYLVPLSCYGGGGDDFVPYVFTHEEIERVTGVFDNAGRSPSSPRAHLVYPAMLRMVYGCGLRAGEPLRLTVSDVDLGAGVLCIRKSKNEDSRYVPMSTSLSTYLEGYAAAAGIDRLSPEDPFFPSARGTHIHLTTSEDYFRRRFKEAGIANQYGRPPRVTDLRHTFAVHSLQRAGELGVLEYAFLPTLAAYMGHKKIWYTEKYLHLTLEGQSRTVAIMDEMYADVYPEVRRCEL